jgi:uncharacterized protein
MRKKPEVESPCISVCAMDEKTGLCQGCYRTAEEIEKWWDLDNAQKEEIVQKASMREAQLFD